MRRLAGPISMAALAAVFVGGCGALPLSLAAPTPDVPCLGELPEIQDWALDHLALVELDAQDGTEVVRFTFDPTDPGVASVTVEPARGRFEEVAAGARVEPIGDQLTSVKFEGLLVVDQADRIRADPADPLAAVRDVVWVEDRNVTRFIIGTAAGACLRLRLDEAAGTVALLVTRS